MQKTHLVPVTAGELHTIQRVLEKYEIPLDFKVSRNTVGFVNKTYIIETPTKKLVLRESSSSTDPDHLRLEVGLLAYLGKSGYRLSPRIILNSYQEMLTEFSGKFYTLQDFIPGEIKASWNNVEHFNGTMLDNFFKTVAEFSKAASGFKASNLEKNLPLPYYTKNAQELLDTLLETLRDSPGKTFIQERRDRLLRYTESVQQELDMLGWEKLPQQIVHFDFHPGNVHYEGEEVVGIFDLDWARFDSRLVDVAGAIGQSCWTVDGPQRGLYIKDKVTSGLKAYRDAYGASNSSVEEENQYIKVALKGYMFFQLLWAGQWYSEQHPSTDDVWVIELNASACLLNDYDSLFS